MTTVTTHFLLQKFNNCALKILIDQTPQVSQRFSALHYATDLVILAKSNTFRLFRWT